MDRASDAPAVAPLRVAVACSPRDGVAAEVALELPPTATALDAIRASGVLERFAELDVSAQAIGIWGRVCTLDARLQDGDRVEIYRPLAMDPNEARRLRARRTRAQATGRRATGNRS
jgi:putative ubiquitin-RnfH superfamily antitoxin RatB of RatAB toxin-antitoxin module